jgi:hypothetical protein
MCKMLHLLRCVAFVALGCIGLDRGDRAFWIGTPCVKCCICCAVLHWLHREALGWIEETERFGSVPHV